MLIVSFISTVFKTAFEIKSAVLLMLWKIAKSNTLGYPSNF